MILDAAIEQAEPVEIERRGHILRIVPDTQVSIWDHLEAHKVITGDAGDLVSLDWQSEWQAGTDL